MKQTVMSSKIGTYVVLAIGTLLAAIGFCMFHFWAKPVLTNARNSSNWPTVLGSITKSELDADTDSDGTTYSADIEYEYAVNGDAYLGEIVWFGDGYSSSARHSHQDIVDRYPVGAQVNVYYKPDDPFIAVLEPGAVASSYAGFILSCVLMVIGLGMLIVPTVNSVFGKDKNLGPSQI